VFSFCPECGGTVWYVGESEPDLVGVPVGGFADPGFPTPMASGWEERKHAWVTISGDDVRHSTDRRRRRSRDLYREVISIEHTGDDQSP
jgi:hypothetical protein